MTVAGAEAVTLERVRVAGFEQYGDRSVFGGEVFCRVAKAWSPQRVIGWRPAMVSEQQRGVSSPPGRGQSQSSSSSWMLLKCFSHYEVLPG